MHNVCLAAYKIIARIFLYHNTCDKSNYKTWDGGVKEGEGLHSKTCKCVALK